MNIPWTEKYRPKVLNDIIGQDNIVKLFKSSITSGELPHLLLYGPPGTGKTSIVFAFAKELFGPKNYKNRIAVINASDERGINVVREKILNFTKTALSSKDPNYPSPEYKLVILDEADTLTTEAQTALRKILEDKSSHTRFCFICNYLNRIIEPIISRCNKYRFKPLNNDSICIKLNNIAIQENLIIEPEIIQEIANINDGDLRKCIMTLQNLKYMSNNITKNTVRLMLGVIDDNMINNIKHICINNNGNDTDIINLAKSLLSFNIFSMLSIICELVIMSDYDDLTKSNVISYFLIIEKRIYGGANEYLQILSLLMHIKNTIHNNHQNNNKQKSAK
ncbi:replication factor C small subunit [Hokovirus HKV1]|uniref:Replication factor C small subunit n=1 Tax=Hokovirus HKV1 TaxID=1977638 RepID=A0A1V0SHJ7_9VIRU|nr:replication factor C small subunit [Hokovirus HKV1]